MKGIIMIAHKGTQQIETERLILRKIQANDADMVYTWMGDSEVCRYERWKPHPNPEYSRGYINEVFNGYKSDCTYQWGIELNEKLIGSVSSVNVDDYDQKATLGYCLAREYWSNGYATEAVKAVLQYMFVEIGLNRIEASHSINNIASGRVLEKAGMLLEGQSKDYYFCNSGFQDSRLFGVTRGQYLRSK
jgi:ribosomal-protein-alanine N-acetyltransferase